jgi:hypothetical protein
MPVLLGNGIRLFETNKELPLKIKNTKFYKSGVIELHYKRG